MPIYEYTCQECSAQFEKFVRSMSQTTEIECPACGGTHVKKALSLFGTGRTNGSQAALSSAASACGPVGT